MRLSAMGVLRAEEEKTIVGRVDRTAEGNETFAEPTLLAPFRFIYLLRFFLFFRFLSSFECWSPLARLHLVFPPASRRFFCLRRFAIFHRLFAAYVPESDTHTYRSKGTRVVRGRKRRGERGTSSRDGKTSTESVQARKREREREKLVKGKAANTRIFIYANGIRIQLIVRSHTRSDSRDGCSGIVPACQFT